MLRRALLTSVLAVLVPSLGFAGFGPKKPKPNPTPVNPPDVRIEVSGISGSGCPQGSVGTVLSPDGQVLSVLFDQLRTDLGPSSAGRIECFVRLRFHFSGKWRVAIVGTDVRGFADLPVDSASTLRVQHHSMFTSNAKTLEAMRGTQTLYGPLSQDILMQSRFHDRPLWSHCGTQGGWQGFELMTLHLVIDSTNKNPYENAITTFDSLDVNGSMSYHLVWRQDQKNCPN